MKRTRFAIVAVIAVLAVLVSPGLASARGKNDPTVTMVPDCQVFPGSNSVEITLSGFPPFAPFHGKLVMPGGGSVEGDFQTDANGEFVAPQVGTDAVGTWTVTITWSGGTLTRSLFVDCPKLTPFGLSVKVERPQSSLRSVRIKATCRGTDCAARVHSAFRVRHPNRVKRLPLETRTWMFQAGVRNTLIEPIPKPARLAARRALANGYRVKVRTRVRASDVSFPGRVRFRVLTSRVAL